LGGGEGTKKGRRRGEEVAEKWRRRGGEVYKKGILSYTLSNIILYNLSENSLILSLHAKQIRDTNYQQ
jgi:hypothetical protein